MSVLIAQTSSQLAALTFGGLVVGTAASVGLLVRPRFPGQVLLCGALQLLPLFGSSFLGTKEPEALLVLAGKLERQPPGTVRVQGCTVQVAAGWYRTPGDANDGLTLIRGGVFVNLGSLGSDPARLSVLRQAGPDRSFDAMIRYQSESFGFTHTAMRASVSPRSLGRSAFVDGTTARGIPYRGLFALVHERSGAYSLTAFGPTEEMAKLEAPLEQMVASLEVSDR